MEVNKEMIERVAGVARLDLTDEEVEKFVPQLKEILETFSKLDEVDTEEVQPSFQPVELKDSFREDKIEESVSQKEALKNVKHKKEGYIMGPKVV